MKTFLVLLALSIAFCICGFMYLQTRTVQALERVGISSALVKDCIWTSYSGGYLSYPSVSMLRQIAAGERAAVVGDIAAFAKSYSRSEEFRKKYREFREQQKPEQPKPPLSMAEQRRRDKENMQKQVREMQAQMKQAPAEHRPIFQQTIEMFKQQLKELDNPDNPMYSPQMDELNNQMFAAQMEEYRQKLAEWEAEYPPTPDAMIKRWLTRFLEESHEVDYSARVIDDEHGRKVFVNPAYESKSPHWKMCYRAGRDVVEAGRTAARQWLAELR
ncbi:MAG TPA: hypothetical protein VNL69_09730 [Bacteroidota bacterium]|nr:hypothetical protein [Bacteroidota bacterium]